MCISLLTEFCHYEQHKLMGKTYERNPNTNFVALCGGYVLARRFGVSTENVLGPDYVQGFRPGNVLCLKVGVGLADIEAVFHIVVILRAVGLGVLLAGRADIYAHRKLSSASLSTTRSSSGSKPAS